MKTKLLKRIKRILFWGEVIVLAGFATGCGSSRTNSKSEYPNVSNDYEAVYEEAMADYEAAYEEAMADYEAAYEEAMADYEIALAESAEEEEAEVSDNLVDGMRPEFKAAIDSYEAMMNEYCDFIEKYSESPSDLGLIAEYADYVTKYADAMEKLDSIEEGELNEAELRYYTEITLRVSERLLKVGM